MSPPQRDIPSVGLSIRREQRLRHKKDFQAVHQHNLSQAHPLLVLRIAPNSLEYSRFGFTVGRRVTRKAVVRNRVRRRIREAARHVSVQAGWDLLFIARPGAADASFKALREAVLDVERRAKVLGPELKGPRAPGSPQEKA